MVHLLGRLYPTDTAARATADAEAEAGIETVAAADATLHTALPARGYRLVTGNPYEAPSRDDTPLSVDLLVPGTGGPRSNVSTTPGTASTPSPARPSRSPDRTIWGDAGAHPHIVRERASGCGDQGCGSVGSAGDHANQ